jgi:signal transduction histidine kinase
VVVLWGFAPGLWLVAVSTGVASLLIQRKPWVRSVFNTGQMVLTMAVVGLLWGALGGPSDGIWAQGRLARDEAGAARLIFVIVALFGCYLAVNRGLVSLAVAWSTERKFLKVVKQDWFYVDRALADLALFFLCPLVVIAFGAVGYTGLFLFYAPLYMICESQKRFLQLQNAQDMMIHRERMAAMGEMAAEIGHEMRNQLVAISGRAQMVLKASERGQFTDTPRDAQIILEQARRMETLSRGLLDSFRPELKMERFDMNALIQRSVEFVRGQNKFDRVEWEFHLGSPLPALRGDPAQLQQVLLNLFINAADAMAAANGDGKKLIVVRSELDERHRHIRLVVTDSGPGIPPKNLLKVFEPSFTTKPDGHGFGLSTSYRIVTNHGGAIVAQNPTEGGAEFRMTLPIEGPSH